MCDGFGGGKWPAWRQVHNRDEMSVLDVWLMIFASIFVTIYDMEILCRTKIYGDIAIRQFCNKRSKVGQQTIL